MEGMLRGNRAFKPFQHARTTFDDVRRLLLVGVLLAAAAIVSGGAATGSSTGLLLTYVVEPLKAPRADFFPGGLVRHRPPGPHLESDRPALGRVTGLVA